MEKSEAKKILIVGTEAHVNVEKTAMAKAVAQAIAENPQTPAVEIVDLKKEKERGITIEMQNDRKRLSELNKVIPSSMRDALATYALTASEMEDLEDYAKSDEAVNYSKQNVTCQNNRMKRKKKAKKTHRKKKKK